VVDKEMPPDPEGQPCRFSRGIATIRLHESFADYAAFGNCRGGSPFLKLVGARGLGDQDLVTAGAAHLA
ncbi:hypothetical protein MNEG_10932, partial [Monoraphidium neglectum]